MDLFCKKCLGLKEEVTGGNKLQFKCNNCGEIYDANPSQTLLASEKLGASSSAAKFKYTVRTTADDPRNPKIERPCPKCGQKVTTYQRMGEKKKLILACDCGHMF